MSEYAAIPMEAGVIDAPKANLNIAELETPRVLFYAMDTISEKEKRELDFKQFGGIHLPHVKLLGNKGMLYRCQLTRLPKYKMVPDWRNMLGPHPSVPHEDSFTQTIIKDGVEKEVLINGFLMSDPNPELKENGEFKQRRSNHVVYRKRYAAQDVALATRRAQMGNAPGGVVELTALKGASPTEVREAQYFFFPKWDANKSGDEALPETIRDTETHIKSRISQINLQLWGDEQKKKYHEIGKQMLASCADYKLTVTKAIRSDETIVKDAAAQGASGTIHHSEISEQYLAQTGTRRKDDLLTGEASNVAELTREMREERQAKQVHDAKMLLLEERKQYTAEIAAGLRDRDADEEVRLGIRKAADVAVMAEESVSETVGFDEGNIRPQDIISLEATAQILTVAGAVAIDNGTATVRQIPQSEADAQPAHWEKEAAKLNVCGAPTAAGTCKRTKVDGKDGCFQHT